MLHYFKFRADVCAPVPAREAYVRHEGGRGWPEECPPLRAANGFGWDVLVTHPMTFHRQDDGTWRLEGEVEVEADWAFQPEDDSPPDAPLTQKNAWFWDRGQTVPHVITDDVWPLLVNQVKVSTYLFLATDPNELLVIGDIPNLPRPYRALTAIVDADWYAASYPWHCVLELDAGQERIEIPAGTPLCRLLTVRRDTYFAQEMTAEAFDAFFRRGQDWLARHGKGPPSGMMDITGSYGRQRLKSRFVVR